MMRWIVLIGLVVSLVFLQRALWFTASSLPKGRYLESRLQVQMAANRRLQRANAHHWAEVRSLKRGLGAIEEHARMDLGLVKRGETFYQIVRVPAPRTAPESPRTVAAPAAGG